MQSRYLLPSPELVGQLNDSKNKQGEAALLTCVIFCTLVPIRSAHPGFPLLRHKHSASLALTKCTPFNKLNSACRCQLYINHTQFTVRLTPL